MPMSMCPKSFRVEPRRHVQRLGGGLAQLIEPDPAVEPAAVDDERVALPLRVE